MNRTLSRLLLGALVVLSLSQSHAHQPSYSKGLHGAPGSAWPIMDVDLSIVLYHEVTCDASQVWMQFNAEGTNEIFFQLGVPVIDRLEDYRPSIALIAPGLPALEEDVPFTVPDGMGIVIFHTEDVSSPELFFEPFTQTESWILFEKTYTLPEPGFGYLVAWHPERQTGKAWIAVGETEDFSNVDWVAAEMWLEKTQTFHETGDYRPDDEPVDTICPEPIAPASPDTSFPEPVAAGADEPTAGCMTSSRAPSPAILFLGLLFTIAWLRRRAGVSSSAGPTLS